MRRPPLILPAVCLWLTFELAAFIAVASVVGIGGAVLLGALSSLAGFAMLRNTGVSALTHLRHSMSGQRMPPGAMLDGLLNFLAALLLILPGFVSDLAGLALAAPSVQQMLARRFDQTGGPAPGRTPHRPEIVDLAPGEWASLDQSAESMRR